MECLSSFCTYNLNNQILRLKLTATSEYARTYTCIHRTRNNYAKLYDTFQLKILETGYIQITRGDVGIFNLKGEHSK